MDTAVTSVTPHFGKAFMIPDLRSRGCWGQYLIRPLAREMHSLALFDVAPFRNNPASEAVVTIQARSAREGSSALHLSMPTTLAGASDLYVRTGDIAGVSAEVGAVAGFLCGLLIGTAFLVVPGLGPVFVAGSLAAALAGAAEGAAVGAAIGGLEGAMVGWGIRSVHVQKYETHIKMGRFLVLVLTDTAGVEYTRSVLAPGALDQPEVHERYLL